MSASPYVPSFQGSSCISSSDFLKIFKTFDKNGNGYIEAAELDNFLLTIQKEIQQKDAPDQAQLKRMKEDVLRRYDTNHDGKIDLGELSKILPTEQNFLATFRNQAPLTSVNFMKAWFHYDKDRSGFIDSKELEGFLFDLLRRDGQELSPKRIADHAKVMIDLFDSNRDGKLGIAEMKKVLPVQENPLQGKTIISKAEFDQVWAKYDADGNGQIKDEELMALLGDMCEAQGMACTLPEIENFKKLSMKFFDANKDGCLSRDELALMLLGKG